MKNGNEKRSTVSVIVPIFKVESYLRTCVESITAQTYRELEIIL
ncbi:MAG: glycosyltransferase family 2 protein, partial [Clostridia bacterium]|nr:glycosyltransferase family 2 protein [Clostridia bacterium]